MLRDPQGGTAQVPGRRAHARAARPGLGAAGTAGRAYGEGTSVPRGFGHGPLAQAPACRALVNSVMDVEGAYHVNLAKRKLTSG